MGTPAQRLLPAHPRAHTHTHAHAHAHARAHAQMHTHTKSAPSVRSQREIKDSNPQFERGTRGLGFDFAHSLLHTASGAHAARSLHTIAPVSYTHLTLPTICSV
eukprot:2774262-Rhodomonas_salina.1